MPAQMARGFTQWLPTLVILMYMAIKTKWAYYKLIKLSQQKKFYNKGFVNTKLWKRKKYPEATHLNIKR